jgi:hypothetical protein
LVSLSINLRFLKRNLHFLLKQSPNMSALPGGSRPPQITCVRLTLDDFLELRGSTARAVAGLTEHDVDSEMAHLRKVFGNVTWVYADVIERQAHLCVFAHPTDAGACVVTTCGLAKPAMCASDSESSEENSHRELMLYVPHNYLFPSLLSCIDEDPTHWPLYCLRKIVLHVREKGLLLSEHVTLENVMHGAGCLFHDATLLNSVRNSLPVMSCLFLSLIPYRLPFCSPSSNLFCCLNWSSRMELV